MTNLSETSLLGCMRSSQYSRETKSNPTCASSRKAADQPEQRLDIIRGGGGTKIINSPCQGPLL